MKRILEAIMDFIKSLLIFLFKLFVVLLVIATAGVAVLAFFLKKDVDEIKEFTENLKREINSEKA
ncbi:hypothetical protein [Salinicoccus sp. HZC-1]|uniref:hypothetical protein n=1 Tax=Salinicoccus sp. HZC-1 TaxID=3385497 RepID=UPI00398B5449